jgi:hypothetical protein
MGAPCRRLGGPSFSPRHAGASAPSSHLPPTRAARQLDLGLIERLQKDWVEGVLAAQREERRRHDRKAAEYDAARWVEGAGVGGC